MAIVTVSTIDRQQRPTSMQIGADDAILTATVQALVDAVDGVILGAASRGVISVPEVVDAGSQVPPADEQANRGNKWLLRVQEATTGKIFRHEIGTADNAQLADPSSDYVDLTAGVGLALKTAFEAAWESDEARSGVLLSVQQVTRKD